jgi:F-type H+-transporting ATPase subunit b
MTVLGTIHLFAARVAAEEFGIDSDGHITTHSAILPDKAELIYGTLASVIIFAGLWKFAGPAIGKAMKARTARIQKELDDAAADRASATAEAAQIRQAKGDIDAERARLLAAAQTQAQTVVDDGRARLELEVADLESKAAADVIAARGRVGDELRAEIARLSIAAVDQVVTGSLDDATHQRLIEDFISRVGASNPSGARS